jgi:hypothetical protein
VQGPPQVSPRSFSSSARLAPVSPSPTVSPHDISQVVLFFGAPRSGFAAQAQLAGAALRLPVLSIEELVDGASTKARDDALAAEAAAAAATAAEAAEAAEADPDADAASGVEAAAAEGTAGGTAGGAEERALEPVDRDLLAAFLGEALSAERHPDGFVLVFPEVAPRLLQMPGGESASAPPWRALLVEAVAALVPERAWVVATDLDASVLEQRAGEELQLSLTLNLRPAAPADISEPEYEALTAGERRAFEGTRTEGRKALLAGLLLEHGAKPRKCRHTWLMTPRQSPPW